jgi:exo-1,4-beta-D-glucosaminidase
MSEKSIVIMKMTLANIFNNVSVYLGTILVCIGLTSCSDSRSTPPGKILLHDNWRIQQVNKVAKKGEEVSSALDVSNWYEATVPSTVMGTLTKNGLFNNIFLGTAIKDVDKTQFDSSWWYRNEFTLSSLVKDQHAILHFDGVSYYANIWLNGKLIASKDSIFGSFRQFSFDITSLINKEKNILAVEVFRQRPGDFGIGFVDWNPRPPDESMGLWREVYVNIVGSAGLQHTSVESKVNTETLREASLTIRTEVVNYTSETLKGTLKGSIDSIQFEHAIQLLPHETKEVFITEKEVAALHIHNPKLWWCSGLGNPDLYKLKLSFIENNTLSDSATTTFGIREIKDFVNAEGYRGFALNGKKVLIKGGGWTDDIFLRDTKESNETQVQYVKHMNLNTIRLESVWGNNQSLYDLCDRYGIMVMTGWTCQWEWENYVGKPCDDFGGIQTEAEMNLMVESLDNQVKWLRAHPSVISWFVGSDKLPKPELETRYKKLLSGIDNRPYVAAAAGMKSTVSGPTGVKMNGPYEYEGPNYWYVDKKNGGAFGFNTETGPGPQIPVKETILKMIPQDKLWPINDMYSYHCTTAEEAFNKLDPFNEAVTSRFGKSDNLDDYIMKSSVVQYEAMRAMFEAFHVNQSKTTGIVQWMLNSAWPSFYWHLYDYYLLPTSAYYAAKKANEPLQLMYNYGDHGVYIVNELNADQKNLKARIQLWSVDGKQLLSKEVDTEIASLTSSKIADLNKMPGVVFLSLELLTAENKHVADNFYWLSAKEDEYKWDKTTWAYTPMKSYSDFKPLNTMPKADVKVTVDKVDDAENLVIDVTLKNSNAIAFFLNLNLKNANGEIVRPVFWNDNYTSLLPNETKHLTCSLPKSLLQNETSLEVSGWNIPVLKIEIR